MIRRVPEITAEHENFRVEQHPDLYLNRILRDPVEPVPVGTIVALIFRVDGYDQDCDGSLMARLARIDAGGNITGWRAKRIGLHPDDAWVLDGPFALDRVAEPPEDPGLASSGIPVSRTCGICGEASIPRGVDWPWWSGGKPVHPTCLAIKNQGGQPGE